MGPPGLSTVDFLKVFWKYLLIKENQVRKSTPWRYLNSVTEGGRQGRLSNKVSGPGLGKFSVRSCICQVRSGKIELGLERAYYMIVYD